jgi:site-specific DNA-methyltransferase (adenine-specific)
MCDSSKAERNGSKHPTIKPLALMRCLVRLVTPPDGLVIDPFAGSGTTGEAAYLEGFSSILIEHDPESVRDIERRLNWRQ